MSLVKLGRTLFCSRVSRLLSRKLLSSQRIVERWLSMAVGAKGYWVGWLVRDIIQWAGLLLSNVIITPWRCLSLRCQLIGCRTLIVWWLRKASRQDSGGHICDTHLWLAILWQDEPSKRYAGKHGMDQCVLTEPFKICLLVLKVLYSRIRTIWMARIWSPIYPFESEGVFSPTIRLDHTILSLYELGETEVLFRVPAVTL